MKNLIHTLILILIISFSFHSQTKATDFQFILDKAIALGASKDGLNMLIDEFLRINHSLKNNNYVTLIDYSLPSTKKRIFIINLKENKVDSYLVAHGKGSGEVSTTHFSNRPDSNMTSIGFFQTTFRYTSQKVGEALKLKGLSASNDKAFERGIVMHGAWYVDPSLIKTQGRIGRSLGCPALPNAVTPKVLKQLEGGSLILGYHPNILEWKEPETAAPKSSKSQIDQKN